MVAKGAIEKLKAVEADCYWFIVKMKEFRNLKNPNEVDLEQLETAQRELYSSMESFRGR